MKVFQLTEADISAILDETRAYFIRRKVSDRDVVKLELLIEEALLRYRDRFGSGQRVLVDTSNFVSTKATIRIKAEPFDPTTQEHDSDSILSSEFLQNLLDGDRTRTTYRYRNGYNELITIAQKEMKVPGGESLVAVVLAVVGALITKNLPDATASFLVNDLAAPLFSKLMGMIVMVAGPLICVSVLSGICALNDVATMSSIGIRAIKRFIAITVMMITFSIVMSLLFFPGISLGVNGAFDLTAIIEMLLDLIPTDLVSPFVENKTIQIIIIAVAIGVALLVLDEKTPVMRTLVSETNQLIFTVMTFVSKIIPLTVFLSIYKAVASNSLSSIIGVWKLVAANYASMVPFTALMVLYVCLRRGIDVRQFLRDNAEPAIVGFTTASSTLAMTRQFDVAINVLKKDKKLVGFWIPLSNAMFSPAVVPALVAAAFYAGNYYGTPISVPQMLILYLLVTQLSIASPKVPGGIMATFSILLGQLGMPTDVVGLLMVANVFVVNAETGLAVLIRSAELEEFSHVIES